MMHEAGYEAQKGLMLRVQRPTAQKGVDINVGYVTARRRVRFMPDEYSLGLGIPG